MNNKMTNQKKTWNDKCAVFGIWNEPEAGWMAYLGLYAQQHRGQEGAGIVSLHQNRHLIHRGSGLVGEVFSKSILQKLKGNSAIGHTRYSTTSRKAHNIQPLTADLSTGPLAIAHNGNIINFSALKKELMSQGSIFYGTSDTECLIHLLAQHLQTHNRSSDDIPSVLKHCLSQVEGAYSLVILTDHSLTAVRDPLGFRPLVLGKKSHLLPDGSKSESWVVASETCAFDLIGAELVREIEPGEIWTVNSQGESSLFLNHLSNVSLKRCVFEHIYFARPDSQVFGRHVYESRKEMGRLLAKESAVSADMVLPIPDSGVASAIGYSEVSGLLYEMGIVRNHYIGRTFIHPSQNIRNFRIKIKLSPQKNLLKNKRVVVVDDSLVRGNTSHAVVALLKKAGVKEVHFRVASPPITGPCFYGVDTPQKEELISAQKTPEEIKNYLQADSLAFLSHKSLMKAVQTTQNLKQLRNNSNGGFCSACFTGKYPTPPPY